MVVGFIRALLGVPPAPLSTLDLEASLGSWKENQDRIAAASKVNREQHKQLAAQSGQELEEQEVPLIEMLFEMGLALAQEAAGLTPAGPTPAQPPAGPAPMEE
jgi:hypothetical protein